MAKESIELIVKNQVVKTIQERYLLYGVKHVVLGFSGGPDSMCLLDVLNSLPDITVHPVHINHGIRKGACDEDQKFCEEYCRMIGLECKSFSFDCQALAEETGLTVEEVGRRIRYDSFGEVVEEIRRNNGTSDMDEVVVAIAQNADDQAETVLMRILRGTGVTGLSGIPYKREDSRGYSVIRPLLDVRKEDARDYCKARTLFPRKDATNEEPVYRRNKIRLELIPHLEENYNPNIVDALIRLAESARMETEHIDNEAEDLINSIEYTGGDEEVDYRREISIRNQDIKDLSPSLRKHAISMFLSRIGLADDVGYEHYKAIERLIMGDNPSANADLPKNYYVRREYDRLIYGQRDQEGISVRSKEGEQEEAREVLIQKLNIKDLDKFLTELNLGPGDYAAYDEEKLVAAYGLGGSKLIEVRKRQPGDVMRLNVGTKKLQDIMVDNKIPVRERDGATVVAIGNDVLWMIPTGSQNRRWSNEFRIDHMTDLVVVMYLAK